MSNPTVLFRSLMVYGLCIPAAVFVGYLLANPEYLLMYRTETFLMAAMIMVLLSPLFLRYYHVWLLATWNASAVIFFLPGSPQIWMALTALGMLIATLQYVLSREHKIISVPGMTKPLIFMAVVVLVTAKFTGGMGLRSFGSDVYGGKRYFMMLMAIAGYFVIVSRQIHPSKAKFYLTLFFLGTATMVIGSTAGLLPQTFNFLYAIFPVENASFMSTMTNSIMSRSWGLSLLSMGVFCAMLARFGAEGILQLQRPHRLGLFVAFVFIGLMGGYRSILIIYLLTFGILLYLEGMLRTRVLPAVVLTTVLIGALTMAFATHLPLSVQRSLAFLPIKIDPIAKLDAQASSEWRLNMWKNVLPEIPEHLWMGKGFLFSSMDDWMIQFKAGTSEASQGSELVRDYHNGPLSVILPFGLPGVAAFLWLMYASLRVLYQNYKYGPEEYKTINTFLLAYFAGRLLFFFTIFGSLYSDLALFTGLVGVSVSLNGGARRPVTAPVPQIPFARASLVGRVRAQAGF